MPAMGRRVPSKPRSCALQWLLLALVSGWASRDATFSITFCGRRSEIAVATPRTTRFIRAPKNRLMNTDEKDDLERWKGRKIEWFFTEGEEDIKLSDLPRPAILPPAFWDWFYETGMYFAVFQAVTTAIGLVTIFLFAPYVVSKLLNAVLGVPMPSGL
mmetsp:Transcript_70580/g.132072  ORF Transcript_70580/g.132072 Transcript_70580/m.132072 type:complete len:158 (-) Transcript_70580:46-519(-)